MLKEPVDIWTDGSSYISNPATRGGWGAVLVSKKGVMRAVSGVINKTCTNNYAEASAVLHALLLLRCPCTVTIFTDSNYVLYGIAALAKGRVLKTNSDVWEQLIDVIATGHVIACKHVRGHADSKMNNWVDVLAHDTAYSMEEVDTYVTELPERIKRKY